MHLSPDRLPPRAVLALALPLAALAAQAPEPGAEPAALSRAEAEAALPALIDACRDDARALGMDELPSPADGDPHAAPAPSQLRIGELTMPFVLLAKGEKPARGWPLFLCLHGGGQNVEAEGPHAWDVNSREWSAQQTLQRRVYEPAGLYFIPRMADDRRGRWWHDHNQLAFDRVITAAILFHDVDPDRVYLIGISEGGYGAIRFAANRPDRFAATGGMAAAEPLSSSPPEDMRNVGLRIDIGENDTMYDRVGLARRMGERLAALHAADPAGYDFVVNVQPGRGHGIDYSLTPKWVAERVRDPRPKRVVWTVRRFDSQVALRRYWLALDAVPAQLPLRIDARIDGDRIELRVEPAAAGAVDGLLRVRLDDRLVDLDRPVTVVLDGRELAPVQPRRRRAVMARTLAERHDPSFCFCAELVVDLAAGTVAGVDR